MIAAGLLGASGRMGRAIALAAPAAGVRIAGGIGRAGAVIGAHADARALAGECDVLIDFSLPDALDGHLEAAVAAARPLVVGTTGLAPEHHALIDRAAARVPVLQAANTSLGVALLCRLVAQAARALDEDWDIEIVEAHHRNKRDAPSGTALLLGAAAIEGRGGEPAPDPSGAPRARGAIGYASLRGGTVAGDHMVMFAGDGERIELGHRAEDRAIFARGALRAAAWLAGGVAPGRYGMADVLGLA